MFEHLGRRQQRQRSMGILKAHFVNLTGEQITKNMGTKYSAYGYSGILPILD